MKVRPAGSWNPTVLMLMWNHFKSESWGSVEMAEPAEDKERRRAVWWTHNLKIEQCGAIHLNSC